MDGVQQALETMTHADLVAMVRAGRLVHELQLDTLARVLVPDASRRRGTPEQPGVPQLIASLMDSYDVQLFAATAPSTKAAGKAAPANVARIGSMDDLVLHLKTVIDGDPHWWWDPADLRRSIKMHVNPSVFDSAIRQLVACGFCERGRGTIRRKLTAATA